jgi:hypothetical protein
LICLNFDSKIFSAVNDFITLSPPIVSSSVESIFPCSSCTLIDFFFSDLPTLEIMNPAIGIKTSTNKLSGILSQNIANIVNNMVSGSFTIISRTLRKELLISFTSVVTFAITSPLVVAE